MSAGGRFRIYPNTMSVSAASVTVMSLLVLRRWFNAGVLMCIMVRSCCRGPGSPPCSPVTRVPTARSPWMLAGISAVDHGRNVGALDPQIEQLTVGASRKLAGDLGAFALLGAPRGKRGQDRLQHG